MASPLEIASLLQRPRGLQEWWRELEDSMHIARARPDFQKNVQKLVTIVAFAVLGIIACALLALRHAPISSDQYLVIARPFLEERDTSQRDTSQGDTSQGDTSQGNTSQGDTSQKDTSQEDTSPEDAPQDWPPFVTHQTERSDNLGQRWREMHKNFSDEARTGDFDVLYFGDSITEGWMGTSLWFPLSEDNRNKDIWNGLNKDLGVTAVNFAIAGDRTLHLLWRLQNGELPARTPKVLILCVGVNDLLSGQLVDETSEQLKRLLEYFMRRRPTMQVALLSVLPTDVRGGQGYEKPAGLNQKLKTLKGDRLHFIDCTSAFSDGNGVNKALFVPDLLHLNEEGYREWAKCIKPGVQEVLKASRTKDR